jgi:FtsP/CotA-like multicopper oxidase with cupredoxin domain
MISLLLLLTVSISGRTQPKSADIQPPDWNSNLKLPELPDLNPDPRIVEVNLDARIADVDLGGKKVSVWTYGGTVPGPLIRANVGDRLIVHFTNHLSVPTTVHWHGIRVPIEMDGVPGISQPEVQPEQSFTYDFVVPDAGLFWYHPHVDAAAQVGFGLSGALLVEDPKENVGVSDEMVLVLNDIDVTEDGKLASADTGGTAAMAFGREGNIVLVNGKRNARITARAGAPQRWRIVNTAKSRYFNIDFRDGAATFIKIGGDAGLQEYPTTLQTIVLGAGERIDVIVTPKGKPGSEIQVTSELFNRGYGSVEFRSPEDLFKMALANMPVYNAPPLPKIHRDIEPLKAEGATPIKMDLDLVKDAKGNNEFHINRKPSWRAVPIPAKIGETQLWTINNTTPWSHPMHLHGFYFQVLDKNGQPVRPLEWKDTVNVPFNETLQVLVRFEDRPGQWMVHCHILDHAEGGLMTTVQLGDSPASQHMMHTKP